MGLIHLPKGRIHFLWNFSFPGSCSHTPHASWPACLLPGDKHSSGSAQCQARKHADSTSHSVPFCVSNSKTTSHVTSDASSIPRATGFLKPVMCHSCFLCSRASAGKAVPDPWPHGLWVTRINASALSSTISSSQKPSLTSWPVCAHAHMSSWHYLASSHASNFTCVCAGFYVCVFVSINVCLF